jgi:hypothetical protein
VMFSLPDKGLERIVTLRKTALKPRPIGSIILRLSYPVARGYRK